MTSPLASLVAGMADTLTAAAGVSVTYSRGDDSVVVSAVPGKTVFRVDTGEGSAERLVRRDYLIKAADLVLSGEVVRPARGDLIRETRGEKVEVYEVMAPGGEPEFLELDNDGQVLRIHTLHVAQEDA
jgi:hypothetical protein